MIKREDTKMICATDDAIKQINRLNEDAYSLRMVLLSIAQDYPDIVISAVHKVKGAPEDIEDSVSKLIVSKGKVAAITFYIKQTGVSLRTAYDVVASIIEGRRT